MSNTVKFKIHFNEDTYIEQEIFLPDVEEFEGMSKDEIEEAVQHDVERAFLTWIDNNMWWEIVEEK